MKSKPQVPNINPSIQEEEKTAPVTGPVYEEVELLKNVPWEISYLENIAYDTSAVYNEMLLFKQLYCITLCV